MQSLRPPQLLHCIVFFPFSSLLLHCHDVLGGSLSHPEENCRSDITPGENAEKPSVEISQEMEKHILSIFPKDPLKKLLIQLISVSLESLHFLHKVLLQNVV